MKNWLRKQWEDLKSMWHMLLILAILFSYSMYSRHEKAMLFSAGIGIDTTQALVIEQETSKSGYSYNITFLPLKGGGQVNARLFTNGTRLQLDSKVPIQYEENDYSSVELLPYFEQAFEENFKCSLTPLGQLDTITTFDPYTSWMETFVERRFSVYKPSLELESEENGQYVKFGYSSNGDTIYERRLIHQLYEVKM
jgi:hypothetical protein